MRRPFAEASRRSVLMLVASVLLLAFVVGAALVPVPYVRLGPGPTFDTLGSFDGEKLVTVSGAPTYPTAGRIDLTTVTETGGPYGDLGLAEALRGWLDPDVAVVPRRLIYPEDKSGEEIEQENAADFSGAEDDAVVAALRHLDIPVRLVVTAGEIGPGTPADDVLETGDVLVSIDGTAIESPEQLVETVRGLEPGEEVELVVRRDGAREVLAVTPTTRPDGDGGAYLGVTPAIGYDSDVEVEFSLEDVGGPSAGLAFALSIVDQLTPGSLTGDRHVAVTGTIDVDGAVGPIGGIQQKLVGADGEGATVFLVPEGNCAAAAGVVPDGLRTVRVSSLDDAVASLDALREGRPVESC